MTQLLNGAPTWLPRPTDILEARKVADAIMEAAR